MNPQGPQGPNPKVLMHLCFCFGQNGALGPLWFTCGSPVVHLKFTCGSPVKTQNPDTAAGMGPTSLGGTPMYRQLQMVWIQLEIRMPQMHHQCSWLYIFKIYKYYICIYIYADIYLSVCVSVWVYIGAVFFSVWICCCFLHCFTKLWGAMAMNGCGAASVGAGASVYTYIICVLFM